MKFSRSIMYFCLLCCSPAYADVAVIVNIQNTNTISEEEIKRIFLGKNKSFADGEATLAINLKSGDDTRVEFEQKVLDKTSTQVKAYWSKLIFTGKAKPIKELSSTSEIINFVAENPNAIAYIDAAKSNEKVKVVKVF